MRNDARVAEPGPGRFTFTSPRLVRVLWLALVAGAIALGLSGVPDYHYYLLAACAGAVCNLDGALTATDLKALSAAGISTQMYATYTLTLLGVATLVWLAVALLIFARRPNDRGALVIALILATANFTAVDGPMTALALAHPTLMWPINVVSVLSDAAYVLLLLLFPDGRFVPSWTRWAVALQLLSSALSILPPPNSPFNAPGGPLATVQGMTQLCIFGVVIYSQVYRYRRVSTSRQREQSKWAVFGLVVTALAVVALNVGSVISERFGAGQPSEILLNTLFPLVLLAVPLSIGVAILRHRLYDIDVIINRTLVYGSLTAILAGLYFAVVIGTQTLTKHITGQEVGQQPIVIVLSTLLIAALFQPLRFRLQRWIDQRFYRSRYDAAKTLAAFSARLRTETDLEELRAHVLGVVDDTMRPTHVSLWLAGLARVQHTSGSGAANRLQADEGGRR